MTGHVSNYVVTLNVDSIGLVFVLGVPVDCDAVLTSPEYGVVEGPLVITMSIKPSVRADMLID